MSTIYLTVPGRIATKPERLTSGKGTGAKFRVASTERWFDRSAEEWNDAQPVYLTVTCWRQLAENVLASLRIGDPVVVHGKLINSGFERDGHSEIRLEISAAAVGRTCGGPPLSSPARRLPLPARHRAPAARTPGPLLPAMRRPRRVAAAVLRAQTENLA